MSSPGAVLALAAVLLWVPGALVGRVLGLRRRWALVAAPALTWGVVAVAGAAVPRVGLAWGPATALGAWGVALVLAGVARGLSRRQGRIRPGGPDTSRGPGPSGAAAVGAAAVGCVVAAGVVVVTAWRAHHQLGAVAQTWDAVWHANLTTLMATTGDSDPVSAPSALAGAGWRTVDTYYPAAMHALAALVVQLTGAGAAVVLDVLLVLLSAAALPMAAAALAGTLAPRRRGTAAGVAAAVAVLPVAYPVDQWWRGVWSYSVALTTAVLVTALAVRALDGRLVPGRRLAAAVVVALGVVGVAGLQPAGAVLAGVLVLAWALARLAGAAQRARSGRLRLAFLAAVAGTLLLPALVLRLVRWSPALASLAAFDYTTRPGTARGLWQALTSVLGMLRQVWPGYGYPVPPQSGQWGLTGVVLAAVAVLAAARETRWLALLWGVLVAAAVSTVAPVGAVLTPAGADLLQSLTLFFYNAPFRLMAVVAVVSAVVVGVAAARLAKGVATSPAGTRRWLAPVSALAAAALFAGLAAGSVNRAAVRLAAGYAPRATGPDQLAVMDRLARTLRLTPMPAGATVANDPLDGSPWLYALHGTPVLFRHYSAGPVTPSARLLLDRLDDVDDDAAVQAALRELRVCYVYASDTPVQDSSPTSPGFSDLRRARALQLVASAGGVAVYRVVVPGTPCAPS